VDVSDWDIEGQEKLKPSIVTVVGIGSFEHPFSIYLTAAGIGTLVLANARLHNSKR